MSTPTFVDILRSEVARMQAAHPERLGEISRAHASIIEGHVCPIDRDNGQVLSRNGHTWYAVNGVCTCEAASFGKPCRHLQAWKLFKHIQRQHDALQPPAPAPQPPAVETEPAVPPPASGALPEAPASITVRMTIAGHTDCLLTLRDTDEGRLLARLQAVLAQYPVPEPLARPAGWCGVHNVQMRETTKDGRTWYSHKTHAGWCKGK